MLFPPSENDRPLFSSNVQQSCSMQMVIQRPASGPITFDWSDFPIVQELDVYQDFPSYTPPDEKLQPLDGPLPSLELASCSSDSDMSSSTARSCSHDRSVSFASTFEIRTHSVVLGEHPCCPQLALELGWDYGQTELVDLDIHEQIKRNYGYGVARRRSYLERKNLLKQVSGMTDQEIQLSALQKAKASTRSLSEL